MPYSFEYKYIILLNFPKLKWLFVCHNMIGLAEILYADSNFLQHIISYPILSHYVRFRNWRKVR